MVNKICKHCTEGSLQSCSVRLCWSVEWRFVSDWLAHGKRECDRFSEGSGRNCNVHWTVLFSLSCNQSIIAASLANRTWHTHTHSKSLPYRGEKRVWVLLTQTEDKAVNSHRSQSCIYFLQSTNRVNMLLIMICCFEHWFLHSFSVTALFWLGLW